MSGYGTNASSIKNKLDFTIKEIVITIAAVIKLTAMLLFFISSTANNFVAENKITKKRLNFLKSITITNRLFFNVY